MHAGRSQEPGGLHHLLGRQPCGVPSAALQQVHHHPEGQVHSRRAQGPDDGHHRHPGNAHRPRRPTSRSSSSRARISSSCTTMRALMKNQPVDEARVAEIGLSLDTIKDIVDRMKRAKFGVIFFGMGLSMTRGKHMNSAGILNIAAEMNAFTKFVCMPMRGHGNVTGADVVLRWTTGLSVRHQFEPRLSALQPRRVFDGRRAGARRQRRDARARRRPGGDDAAAGDRSPGANADHRAGSEGDAHEPAGAGPFHDRGLRHQRARDGLSHGRDSDHASSGPEIAVRHATKRS